jgi:hypothetical protein
VLLHLQKCIIESESLNHHFDRYFECDNFEIEFNNGKKMLATSTHHQMMYPYNVRNFELIAWASTRLSDIYEMSGERDAVTQLPQDREPEIVYYPDKSFDDKPVFSSFVIIRGSIPIFWT